MKLIILKFETPEHPRMYIIKIKTWLQIYNKFVLFIFIIRKRFFVAKSKYCNITQEI